MGLFDRLDREGPRVAFLGIDGVPYSLIHDKPDVFPHLHDIIATGTGASIDSVIPPESSACWPALTTGQHPGNTGVYGFQERNPDAYRTFVPQSGDVACDRVWDRVHAAGRRATVLNVPVTFPPQRDVQRMIAGFLAPGLKEAATPDGVSEIASEQGYRIDVDARLGHREDKSAFFEDAHATLLGRYETYSRFIEADDWDLFFGVFMTPDRVNHFAFEDYEAGGTYRDAFLDFYRTLDRYIGELYAMLPDDVSLVIASDHGFTTLEYEFDANAWLHDAGWLTYGSDDPAGLTDIGDETRAYALVPGRFYLNLEGREPRGSVPATEYEAVRSTLQAELAEITGPDDSPIFDRIVTREEAYGTDPAGQAPDLIGLPRDGYDLKVGFNPTSPIFSKGARNGMHTFGNATLIVDDPVAFGDNPTLLDIAPYILERMQIETAPTHSLSRS